MKQQVSLFNYSVQNKDNDTLDVHIDGYIVDEPTREMMKAFWGDETSVSYKSIRNQIKEAKPKTVNFIINSGGGHVGDAMAIADFMDELKVDGVKVTSKGTGIVASAATYPLIKGGENSSMTENSWFMIHNVSGGIYGDVNEIENYAKMMRKFNNSIRDFYAAASGQAPEQISAMMNKETWMTAAETKDKGFIKNISGRETFTNKLKAEQWPFENKTVLNSYNANVGEKETDDKTFLTNLKTEAMKLVEKLSNIITGAKEDKGTDKIANKADILDLVNKVLTPFANAIDEKIKDEEKAEETPEEKTAREAKEKEDKEKSDKEAKDKKDGKDGKDGDGKEAENKKMLQLENELAELKKSIALNGSKPDNSKVSNDILKDIKIEYQS